MSIEVTRLDTNERDEWNQYVDRTPEAMPFHRHEAIEAIADASDTTSHLLVGFKGQEPVGLLPLFEDAKGPLTLIYSPPTELELPYLGPLLLNTEGLKKRKAEKRNRRFVESCVGWLDATVEPDHVDVRTTDRYLDARPFVWNGFDVEPSYTYVLDLEPGEDELLQQFSSTTRKRIRGAEDDEYEIEEGGRRTIRNTISQLRRHIDDESFGLDADFVVDLYERLPDGFVRPYECRVDDEFAGGIITLESTDTVYRWQGGATPDVDLPVNELLDWHIIRGAADRGKSRYELVGAMTPRLCMYKSKFGPELGLIQLARRKSLRMRMISSLYERVPSEVKAALDA